MPRYRYAIDENAVTALLALNDAQIASLVAAFEALADQPAARPDSDILDAHGRPLANKIAGDFLIGYWSEHAARRLHLLRIDPLYDE